MCRLSQTYHIIQSFILLPFRSVNIIFYKPLLHLDLSRRKQLLTIRKDMQTAKDLVFSLYQNLETILTNSHVRI